MTEEIIVIPNNVEAEASKKISTEEIVEKYAKNGIDVKFLHGIAPFNFNLGINSMIERRVDWKTKLAIVATMNPNLCASSHILGKDNEKNMFSNLGLIIGGDIEAAYRSDAGSRASGLKKRGSSYRNKAVTLEQIDYALGDRNEDSDRYNELFIETPKIHGFYLCLDEPLYRLQLSLKNPNLISHRNIHNFVDEELSMPVFVYTGEKFYEGKFNDETGKFEPIGEPVTGKSIIESEYKLSEKQRAKLTKEICEDSPFNPRKINSPDFWLLDSGRAGAEFYYELNSKSILDSDLSDRKIGDINTLGWLKSEYFAEDGRIKRHQTRESRSGELEIEIRDYIEKDKYPFLTLADGRGLFMDTDLTDEESDDSKKWKDIFTDNDAYLEIVKKYLEEKDHYLTQIDKGRPGQGGVRNWIAFHLYGFAGQARLNGEDNVANRAENLAGTIYSKDKYKALVEKRLGEHGKFKLTQEDLDNL